MKISISRVLTCGCELTIADSPRKTDGYVDSENAAMVHDHLALTERNCLADGLGVNATTANKVISGCIKLL